MNTPETTPEKPFIPAPLLIIHPLGMFFLGLGLMKVFGGIEMIPEEYMFPDYGWPMIWFGAAMGLPALLSIAYRLIRNQD